MKKQVITELSTLGQKKSKHSVAILKLSNYKQKMSEDELSEPYEPTMKLFIENLMGTTFKIRVYSTGTILDLKNKIQRVEGGNVQNIVSQY